MTTAEGDTCNPLTNPRVGASSLSAAGLAVCLPPRRWRIRRSTSRWSTATIITCSNPLLYQVATAGLSPADIASPIRGILRDQKNAKVILADVSGIDVIRKEVIADGRRIPYDSPRLFRS